MGVEEKTEVEAEDCVPCAGDFPKGEGDAGIEKKLDGDGLEVDELDDGSGLEATASSFSFCIFRYADLYDSRIPDMLAKGSSSTPLEMTLRREWFNPRRLI